ncbi:MAG: hypothetical protein K2P17_00745 [Helicobacteraceae bacterium]|nr:hypothetical protein [Helicobacteraceae bacterium]
MYKNFSMRGFCVNILSKAKKLNFNTKQFNINYILAIIFVYIGTLAIFSIARILMVLTFIQNDLV